MRNGRQLSRVWFHRLFVGSLAFLLVFGCLLWRNETLKKLHSIQMERVKERAFDTKAPLVGSTIPLIRGRTLTQQQVTLDLSRRESGTLLLVLSPACPYCRVNFHNWRDLLRTPPKEQIVWIDLTGTADVHYLASYGIPTTATVLLFDEDNSKALGIFSTPTTVLVNNRGVVEWVAAGLMDNEQVAQLRSLLTPSKS